jgi:hypothetical protein
VSKGSDEDSEDGDSTEDSEEDVDITPFVTEQSRRELGRRLRNPKVKALLDAGMRLLQSGVDSGIEYPFRFPSSDAVCTEAANYPPFRSSPLRRVGDEVERLLPPPGPLNPPERRAAENAFKKTWRPVERYRADLAMYTLTMPTWFAGDEIAKNALEQMVTRADILDAVLERIASQDLRLFEDALFRVQLVMQAMAPSEDVIRQALDRMYANIDRTWTAVYQGILDHYHAGLRPDVTVLDIAHILTAAAEGAGLRLLIQPDDKTIFDAVRRRSILGKTALCVFAASVTTDGDGRTLADFFRETLTRNNAAGG